MTVKDPTVGKDEYCIRHSTMPGLGEWVNKCNLTMLV